MFGPFKSAPFSDPMLGDLIRSRGLWRGMLQLDSGSTKLALAGTRTAPDPAALAVARELKAQLPGWRSTIEMVLFEHYEPYAEAVATGECPETKGCFPSIAAPNGVWPHASLEFICISPLDGFLTTELGYITAWDEEHTLGARFAGGTFIALCGSVLPP